MDLYCLVGSIMTAVGFAILFFAVEGLLFERTHT